VFRSRYGFLCMVILSLTSISRQLYSARLETASFGPGLRSGSIAHVVKLQRYPRRSVTTPSVSISLRPWL